MKKLVTILLTLVMVLAMSSMAFANPVPKTVLGKLEVLTTGPIYVGDTVNLQARILKHGSKFTDLTEMDIELYEDGYYVINLTATAGPVGIQPAEFKMTMTAGNGKSLVVFNGIASTEFTVVERPVVVPEIVSYEITDWIKGTEIKNPQGNIIGYNAIGTLWAVYDNGTKVLVDGTFAFTLTRLNDNLKTPETYNGLPVDLN